MALYLNQSRGALYEHQRWKKDSDPLQKVKVLVYKYVNTNKSLALKKISISSKTYSLCQMVPFRGL